MEASPHYPNGDVRRVGDGGPSRFPIPELRPATARSDLLEPLASDESYRPSFTEGVIDRVQFWTNLTQAMAIDLNRMRSQDYVYEMRDRERTAKAAIDQTFERAGFVKERVTFRRRFDDVPYDTTVLYKEGSRFPERCIVFGHGFTAGYESLESLTDLDDFSLLLYDRPGIDPDSAAEFVRPTSGFDARRHYREQMHGQEQAATVAVDRGATEVILGGHSMSGMITLSNLFELRQWDPALSERVVGSIMMQAPGSENVFHDSPLGKVVGIERVVHLLGAVADNPRLNGTWRQMARFLPSKLRGLKAFSPEQITRGLASTLVVDQMLGDVDGDAYGASKWRAKHTPWEALLADLRCMMAVPPRFNRDHLLDRSHLVIEGTHDRLVAPGTGRRIVDLLSGGEHGCERVSYRRFQAGHYAMVSDRAEVNQAIYRFAATAGAA